MASTQVETGHTATIEARFYADGALADDGVPTVGITRADGTVLVASGTATSSGGVGVRQYALPAQPEVNLLKATWTGATQTVVTWVEIVGGILYTLAAFRALRVAGGTPFADPVAWPNQALLDTRAEVTDELQRILGFAPVPRYARELFDGDGRATLQLHHHKASKIISVTVDGTVQTLANFTLYSSGQLAWNTGWFPTTSRGNVAGTAS